MKAYFQTRSVAQRYRNWLMDTGFFGATITRFRTGWRVFHIGIRVNW